MTDNDALDELFVANGIDAGTGDYATSGLSLSHVAGTLRGDLAPTPGLRDLRRRQQEDEDHFGVIYGRNPEDLASVGWGLVVTPDIDPAVLEAISPLLQLREEQAGALFRRFELRPGEDKDNFLARQGMGPSVVDPRKVPYYLLLLGPPEQIPFDFQYQLGVSYAVGRLDLETAGECAAYAASVVASEQGLDAAPGGEPSGHRLHLFATRHPGDVPTALSAARLVEPLRDDLRDLAHSWELTADVGEGATRTRLQELLVGPTAPDILFTATHGVGGRSTPQALAGALLCQDWPGPIAWRGPLDEGQYLAGGQLPDSAIRPKVVFSFACFGAGTPQISEYPGGLDGSGELAESGFTARLPQRLLGTSAGGALAFVGHVDRAWSCSFLWKGLDAQITPFSSTLLALMDGVRLGSAMESLSSRYAEIATELTRRLDEFRRYGKRIDDADLVGLWTATHDARAQVVLGDPAVRVARRGSAGLNSF